MERDEIELKGSSYKERIEKFALIMSETIQLTNDNPDPINELTGLDQAILYEFWDYKTDPDPRVLLKNLPLEKIKQDINERKKEINNPPKEGHKFSFPSRDKNLRKFVLLKNSGLLSNNNPSRTNRRSGFQQVLIYCFGEDYFTSHWEELAEQCASIDASINRKRMLNFEAKTPDRRKRTVLN